uniref:Ig-like domain-containing protein n=1 Tax=Lates calcarifer TaxID=8187 RepID=A0A4W6E000_LATCA
HASFQGKNKQSLKKPSIGQKPVFIHPITSCVVPHGEVARFHACVSGMPKPEISWFHNQQPVQPTKNVVFHFDEVTNTATLIIVDAFSEHAGQYTCRAANNAGEAACSTQVTIYLNFFLVDPPSFVRKLENLSSLVGSEVSLTCTLKGSEPMTVSWLKENHELKEAENIQITYENKTALLHITNLQSKHGGKYSCQAQNQAGKGIKGSFAHLECLVSGSLPITIQWYKDKKEIQTDEKHKCTFFENVAFLEISNLDSKDSGSYTCIAKNKAGTVQCSGTLFVKGLFLV